MKLIIIILIILLLALFFLFVYDIDIESWLKKNMPNLREEFKKEKKEIKESFET